MNHFDYINNTLHVEDVAIEKIAAEIGTPFYIYSTKTLLRHYQVFSDAMKKNGLDALICYAVKANPNLSIIKTLANVGCGADVVSEGELRKALAAGIPANKIVFSGVGKSHDEIKYAIEKNIHEINVESYGELEVISQIAVNMNKQVEIAIRLNPDVDAGTHEKISTGKKENKFGIDMEMAGQIYAKAANLPGIKPVSVAVHIGSQLTSLEPYRQAFSKLAETITALQGQGIELKRLDLGGGLGIPYDKNDATPPSPDEYAKVIKETVGHLNLPIMLEPGRMIVGNAGMMIAKVIGQKNGVDRKFIILDAAMNDLIRPTLYNGHHEIIPIKQNNTETQYITADIVGPICESGDIFAKGRKIPILNIGDMVAFGSAGAYGASMSSTYNSRRLIPEILVDNDKFAIIRKRQTYEELLALDKIASWLQ